MTSNLRLGINWGLAPNRSNPGYYSISIAGPAELRQLGSAFPDMLESDWLAEEVARGPFTDTIGLWFYKDSEDHWVGKAWWNDKNRGLDIHINRDTEVDENYRLEWTLNFRVMPMTRSGLWTVSKPIGGTRTLRSINPKAEAAWALKRYFDSLQAPTVAALRTSGSKETPVEEALSLVSMLTNSGGAWPTMRPPSDAALAIMQETIREAPVKVYRGIRLNQPYEGEENRDRMTAERFKEALNLKPGDRAPAWLRKAGNDYASSSKNIQKARYYMKDASFQILLSATVDRSDILVDLTNWKRVLAKYDAVDPDENWTYYSREKEVIVLEPITWTVEEIHVQSRLQRWYASAAYRPRRADKMDDVDLKALENTPEAWQELLSKFPEGLVREFVEERPDPSQEDIEWISGWKLNGNAPVEIALKKLLSEDYNKDSVTRTPVEVVEAINKKWGTSIKPGKVYDPNPGRYFEYAKFPASSAKPSVALNGGIIWGVGRFIAALLRGDKTMKVWDLRTTKEGSSRNRKGYAIQRRAGKTVKLYRGEPIWLKSDNNKENEARYKALKDAVGKPYPARSTRAVYCSPDYQYAQDYVKGSTYPGKPSPDFGVVSIIETPLSNVEIDEAVVTNLYAFGSDKIEQAGAAGVKQLQDMFVKVFGPAVKQYLKADANFSDQAAVDKLRNKPEVVKQWVDTIQGGGELKTTGKGKSEAEEYLENISKNLQETVDAIGRDEEVVDYFLHHKPTGDITEWAFKIIDPSKTKLVEVKEIKIAKTASYAVTHRRGKANRFALYTTAPFIPFEKVPVFSCIPYLSRTTYKYVSDSCVDGRDLVQGLKDGDASAIKAAAKIMAKHPKLRNFKGALVPVPRSTSSKLNTNKLLCEELVRLGVGSLVSSMVHRVHDVESSRLRRRRLGPQHGLSKEQHYESMGVSGVPDDFSVVLVDDVFTAGTTIKAAAARLRMFRHQGEISGATLAYVTNDTTSCSPQYTTKTAKTLHRAAPEC